MDGTTLGVPSRGRFPHNEISTLFHLDRPFNLAESTSRHLTLGEAMSLAGPEALAGLSLAYGPPAGLPALREAAAALCGVGAEEIVTTQGTALALFLLALELCRPGNEPGDEAVLASPCFAPTRDGLVAAGATVREVRQTFGEGYRLDPDRVGSLLTERTVLVSLATPANPSGVAVDEATIVAILGHMERRAPRALLFLDETYREAAYGAAGLPSFAALDPRVLTASSLSKAHGAPGLRVGWLTVRDPGLRARLVTAKMNLVLSGSVLDETLGAALLRHPEAVVMPRRALLAEALGTLGGWHAGEGARLEWVRPDAGALCCFRLAHAAYDDAAVRRFWAALPSFDLQLAKGAWFGDEERVFRLGFGAMPQDRLRSALDALSCALDHAAGGRASASPFA